MRNTQNATSVSSLDIRNTRKAHRNLQQIHLSKPYPRHELVRDLLLTQEKTVPRYYELKLSKRLLNKKHLTNNLKC